MTACLQQQISLKIIFVFLDVTVFPQPQTDLMDFSRITMGELCLFKTTKKPLETASVNNILTSVPYERGFHFFSDIGLYTGETAINLPNFCEQLKKAEPQTVRFHFNRKDFQNWIGQTLGDKELVHRINHIDSGLSDSDLKLRLVEVIQTRLNELRFLL